MALGSGGIASAAIGGAQMLMGIGKSIGAAARQAKAEKEYSKAGNIQENAARAQLAAASNPMANQATQQAMATAEQNVQQQAQQQAAQNAIMGGTPEMTLAQQQMNSKALSDVYSNVAQTAMANYDAARNGLYATKAQNITSKADRLVGQAEQLNESGANDMSAGLKIAANGLGNADNWK